MLNRKLFEYLYRNNVLPHDRETRTDQQVTPSSDPLEQQPLVDPSRLGLWLCLYKLHCVIRQHHVYVLQLQLLWDLVCLVTPPVQRSRTMFHFKKHSQWTLMKGGSQSRHAAQPFWYIRTSKGTLKTSLHATTCGRIFIFPQLACDSGKTNS